MDSLREKVDDAETVLRDLFEGEDVQVMLAGNPIRIDKMMDRVRAVLAGKGVTVTAMPK